MAKVKVYCSLEKDMVEFIDGYGYFADSRSAKVRSLLRIIKNQIQTERGY